jgi:hypothetical protein
MSPYPIIDERSLSRIPGRFLLPRRRDLDELPPQPSGTVLVAFVDGGCELISQRDLSPTSDTLVNASSIAVVDTRPASHIVAEFEVSSAEVAQPFTVRAFFTCQVTDPVTVLRSVPHDLQPELVSHLKRDKKLMSIGARFNPSQLSAFERHAAARITAWCIGRPPNQPGMTIELNHVDVPTPTDLRQHVQAMAGEERRQKLEQLKTRFTYNQALFIEAVLNRGPEAIEALYLEIDDDRYLKSAERAYGEREITETRLRGFIQMLSDRGHFDRAAIDTPRLMNEFVDGLLQRRERRLRGEAAGSSIFLGDSAKDAGLPGADNDGDATARPPEPPDEDTIDG